MVLVINRQKVIKIDVEKVKSAADKMIAELGYPDFDVNLVLTTDDEIHDYNKRFREKDSATDVLSFPFHSDVVPGEKIEVQSEDEKNLGDIVISVENLRDQCGANNPDGQRDGGQDDEFFYKFFFEIVAHGMAHLLNYTHETDEEYEKMVAVEKRLLSVLNS